MIQCWHIPALLAPLEHCTLISNTSQHLYVRLMLPYEEDDIFPMTKKNLNMYIHCLKWAHNYTSYYIRCCVWWNPIRIYQCFNKVQLPCCCSYMYSLKSILWNINHTVTYSYYVYMKVENAIVKCENLTYFIQ